MQGRKWLPAFASTLATELSVSPARVNVEIMPCATEQCAAMRVRVRVLDAADGDSVRASRIDDVSDVAVVAAPHVSPFMSLFGSNMSFPSAWITPSAFTSKFFIVEYSFEIADMPVFRAVPEAEPLPALVSSRISLRIASRSGFSFAVCSLTVSARRLQSSDVDSRDEH